MNQNINLYQPMFRRERKLFSAHTMGISIAILVAGLVLIQIVNQLGYNRLETRLTELEQEEQQALDRLERMREELPTPTESPALQQRVERTEQQRDLRRRALELLDAGEVGRSEGFSEHLAGVARQRIDPVWLTRIHLSEGGRHIHFEGRTLNPDRVPGWVRRLADEAAYEGVTFRHMRIEQDAEAAAEQGALAFRLSTRPREDDE